MNGTHKVELASQDVVVDIENRGTTKSMPTSHELRQIGMRATNIKMWTCIGGGGLVLFTISAVGASLGSTTSSFLYYPAMAGGMAFGAYGIYFGLSAISTS